MVKFYIVISGETNNVGIYTKEDNEINCLGVYDANGFDADNLKKGVMERYTMTSKNGNLLQEDGMTESEYDRRMLQAEVMAKFAEIMDGESFHDMINN